MEREIHLIDPFRCRVWANHDRLSEYLTEESCRDEIHSFRLHGQKAPVLVRPVSGDEQHDYELIYGSRRLFVARVLRVQLAAEVRALTDREALIAMDAENRLRRDLSPYERGINYRSWLRKGLFATQSEMSRVLGLSNAQLCRLLKFADLPTAVVAAFRTPLDIKESWAVELVARCEDPETRTQLIASARFIKQQRQSATADRIYSYLVRQSRVRNRRAGATRDEIVRVDRDRFFRISWKQRELRYIVPSRQVTDALERRLTEAIRMAIRDAREQSCSQAADVDDLPASMSSTVGQA